VTGFVPRSPSPLIKAREIAWLRFARRDLTKAVRYYTDFGLRVAARTERAVYLRGLLPRPHCLVLEQAPHDDFLSLAFEASSENDLRRLADATGHPVEDRVEPGGGRSVLLEDPSGFTVEVVHGVGRLPALPARSPKAFNDPLRKQRINAPQPALLRPTEVYRLGHVVLARQEFARNARWYVETLGLIASDVEVVSSLREPSLAFLRFDRGTEPADHHSIVLAAAPEDAYGHAAFETLDVDALGEGAEYLQHGGWTKSWGIGRHLLGSQLFCYHVDPSGYQVEHYADGDVFDASVPTRWHEAGVAGLYQWGPELPPHFIDTRMTPARLARVARGLREREELSLRRLAAIKKTYSQKPRPWAGRPFRRPQPE
jgi:catechol 2,3-dioxygenase-like lactoylglutathione lyase family enzyme